MACAICRLMVFSATTTGGLSKPSTASSTSSSACWACATTSCVFSSNVVHMHTQRDRPSFDGAGNKENDVHYVRHAATAAVGKRTRNTAAYTNSCTQKQLHTKTAGHKNSCIQKQLHPHPAMLHNISQSTTHLAVDHGGAFLPWLEKPEHHDVGELLFAPFGVFVLNHTLLDKTC